MASKLPKSSVLTKAQSDLLINRIEKAYRSAPYSGDLPKSAKVKAAEATLEAYQKANAAHRKAVALQKGDAREQALTQVLFASSAEEALAAVKNYEAACEASRKG